MSHNRITVIFRTTSDGKEEPCEAGDDKDKQISMPYEAARKIEVVACHLDKLLLTAVASKVEPGRQQIIKLDSVDAGLKTALLAALGAGGLLTLDLNELTSTRKPWMRKRDIGYGEIENAFTKPVLEFLRWYLDRASPAETGELAARLRPMAVGTIAQILTACRRLKMVAACADLGAALATPELPLATYHGVAARAPPAAVLQMQTIVNIFAEKTLSELCVDLAQTDPVSITTSCHDWHGEVYTIRIRESLLQTVIDMLCLTPEALAAYLTNVPMIDPAFPALSQKHAAWAETVRAAGAAVGGPIEDAYAAAVATRRAEVAALSALRGNCPGASKELKAAGLVDMKAGWALNDANNAKSYLDDDKKVVCDAKIKELKHELRIAREKLYEINGNRAHIELEIAADTAKAMLITAVANSDGEIAAILATGPAAAQRAALRQDLDALDAAREYLDLEHICAAADFLGAYPVAAAACDEARRRMDAIYNADLDVPFAQRAAALRAATGRLLAVTSYELDMDDRRLGMTYMPDVQVLTTECDKQGRIRRQNMPEWHMDLCDIHDRGELLDESVLVYDPSGGPDYARLTEAIRDGLGNWEKAARKG